ncbi:MAG: 2-octaprenyl-6-methoxyphenyl hydroxylase [Alphaproteobacteria bacterium]|jgi:2-octaprenyl-6-methoxyphenol hydroxylase|nr:2-octaprenyl-6-methoxyphenyl hydroxylase [Alphaproteobacteria bacterium]PPR14035.1 MAG: 2-octaprenylphenol hydroxylase [Alphaproteobacteria bacterium MarineAlpha12_Bin1]|tara:strand:+ start:2271 stop:3518 length:1248 start_codon:yes stop_codon:yes gene_type:complete
MLNNSLDKNMESAEVCIVGGGLIGLTLALALSSTGLEVAIVERVDLQDTISSEFDGRATAISNGSAQVIKGIGLWNLVSDQLSPINDIRVSDKNSLFFLHYDHTEVGNEPLGYIIENRLLRLSLLKKIKEQNRISLLAPAKITEINKSPNKVQLKLADGRKIKSQLLLACDGKNSSLRESTGIPVTSWNYNQSSIVFSVFHEISHDNLAHELFLPGGPFAILPMVDLNGRHRSAVVWTDSKSLIPSLLALKEEEFISELYKRFGDFLGKLEIVGSKWTYPLSLLHAQRYIDHRFALVGDAAHSIHPIAGQGLNMGIRDIAALSEVIVDARRLGADIGLSETLSAYERWRRFDNLVLAVVTDTINKLFSNDIPPVRTARRFGLGTINEVAPLRRALMRHAMGTMGELPRLIRGESL